MKHPFFTLYYTGIGILVCIGLILSLLVLNIPNISRAFSKETPSPEPYSGSMNVKVLQNIPTQEPQKPSVKETVRAKPENSIPKVESKEVKQDSATSNSEEQTSVSPDSSSNQ